MSSAWNGSVEPDSNMEHHEVPAYQQRSPRRRRSSLYVHRAAPVGASRRSVPAAPEPEPAPALNNEELQRQAELERDLQMARDIQQGLLLAAVPSIPGWELTAVSNPARDLGGDLYDFLALPDGRQGIMIGDVSGKGLPAALRMAVARTVFRHQARQGEAPAPTMAAVNWGVCTDIPQGMVTMLYIVLDPAHGTLTIANAGHTYPFLLNGQAAELELPGMPLGVDPDIDYEELDLAIGPGDSLFLYTDGVTEATNAAEEMFGTEYLQQLLETNSQLKPRALMRLLLRELRTWSEERTQDDDITMVVFRRRYLHLSDELYSIAGDVLGTEQAERFWAEQVGRDSAALRAETPDAWMERLPDLSKAARAAFNRGLARELSQQLRLAMEDYRGGEHE
jgi:sigma-B regulation protein RsbU (phosphoserine phosphatase)